MKAMIKNLMITVFAILVLAGCGPAVTTSKTANVDLDSYQTYAWLPDGNKIENEKYKGKQLDQAIITEVNDQLQSKGYSLNRKDPDLLVLVHTMFNEETSTVKEPVYASYDYYTPGMYINPYYDPYYYYDYPTVTRVVGYDIDQVNYTEGTLVIDLIDRNTKTVVWRGRAEDYVKPYNATAEVRDYVDEIFEEFPSS